MWAKRKKSPETSLYDIFETLEIEPYKKTILQERYLSVLSNFQQRSVTLAYMFYITRIIVTVGSILVPAFLSIQGSTNQMQLYWVTWVLSLSVTISNGFMTLFKVDKKYFFINTTLELLCSEGWQYVGLSGRYSGKDTNIPPTHDNQFLVFFHMAEKIKMRQVEEEYWKFTDTSGVGNATNQKGPLLTPTPLVQQGKLRNLPDEQKNVIDQWVGEMKSDMLGLQPRARNLPGKLDESPRSPGISGTPQETTMSVRPDMQAIPTFEGALVQLSPSKADKDTQIPQNTFITVMPEESDVWSGASPRS